MTFGGHTKATPTYLAGVLLQPKKASRLLGVRGVRSPLPARGPTEVVGQREDAMRRSPCATHLGWESGGTWSTSGRCDGAGALLCDRGEGAGVNGPSFFPAVLSHCRNENFFMQQGGDRASFGWHRTGPSHAESTTAGAWWSPMRPPQPHAVCASRGAPPPPPPGTVTPGALLAWKAAPLEGFAAVLSRPTQRALIITNSLSIYK